MISFIVAIIFLFMGITVKEEFNTLMGFVATPVSVIITGYFVNRIAEKVKTPSSVFEANPYFKKQETPGEEPIVEVTAAVEPNKEE